MYSRIDSRSEIADGRRRQPMMVLIGGPPGSGKTTVASELARRFGWVALRSDVVRHDIVSGQSSQTPSEWLSSRFAPRTTEATYRELIERARMRIAQGESVLLDATWCAGWQRQLAADAALAAGAALVCLRCVAPADVAERRVAHRIAAGDAISEATVAIVRRLAASFEPWPSASQIDTDASPAATIRDALKVIRAHRAGPRPTLAEGVHRQAAPII